MEKTLPTPLPEIVFGSADMALSKAIGRAVKAGRFASLQNVYILQICKMLLKISSHAIAILF
jgi:hypothetical protein